MKLLRAAIVLLLSAHLISAQSPAAEVSSATVPVTLDHNRIIIDVYFPMSDGSKTRVRGWIDPGDAEMSITDSLAKKLGLAVAEKKPDQGNAEDNKNIRTSQAPHELLVGTMKIDLSAIKQARVVSQGSIAPGSSASIKLPGPVLRNYDVVIDYLNREFTIAAPGVTHFEGTAVKASIGQSTGLIQLGCSVAGERHTVSFDPGTSVSWLSGELISKWHKQHPQWPSMVGAVGPANLWGLEAEPTWQVLRIPQIECGTVSLTNGVAVPFDKNTLEWFQKRAGVPTIGLIGADVVLNYRVGIDYTHSTIYFKQLSKYTPAGVDVVGVTLRPEADEHYTIIGVSDYEGKPSVPDVKLGDTLMTIDNARVTGGTMGQVWSLLSGSPGDTRTLSLVRAGKPISVKATVYRFLPSVKIEAKAKKN